MRIALAQLNLTIGDFVGNSARLLDAAREAQRLGADLLLSSELALVGYPPRDMLELPELLEHAERALQELTAKLPLPTILGHTARNPSPYGRPLCNAASLIAGGQCVATYYKRLLPVYDVFDESRYFEPGNSPLVVQVASTRIGISICEDLWNEAEYVDRPYATDPLAELVSAGAEVIVNLSASPWQLGKNATRHALFARCARDAALPLCYCNQVGGNDQLIFDGGSFVFDATGRCRLALPRFAEAVTVVDLAAWPASLPPAANEAEGPAELVEALVLGIADYARKTGFQRALVGLSGGIDSAVTAALATRALGRENVTGVTMPSAFSSAGSVSDSYALANHLGIAILELPIHAIFEAACATLAPVFTGLAFDVTEENLQARIRGMLLMALSNKHGALLLTTGNKSELAVGYCTLYGDMCGGLAVISDVPKTMVYQLADELDRQALAHEGRRWIPAATHTKPPSAELRPGQTDQDSLPPYDQLDAILAAYIEQRMTLDEICALGHARAVVKWVIEAVDRNEYKRAQAAPGLRVTSRAFGVGRRMPIAQRFRRD
jgi:NAD+ synthetase